MRRSRITITLQQQVLQKVDRLIDGKKIRNRSHAIEYILNTHLQNGIKTAVILAGGKGTHMRPYTYELPKPLLLIKGKPILEYIIRNLKSANIDNIIICIGYLGEKIKEYFGNGEKFGVSITYSYEKEPLQTGGSILKIKNLINNQPFIVIYGDTLTNLNLQDIVQFHMEYKVPATISLTSVTQPGDFGQLKLHGIKLVNFFQKTNNAEVKSNLINCGMYVFEPEIFNYFPKNLITFSLEDVIESLIRKKAVNGFVFEEQWFDVGNSKDYEKAIKEFIVSPYPDQKFSQ